MTDKKRVYMSAAEDGKDYMRHDEVYSGHYRCPHCHKENIYHWFKYCPDCGIRLYWKNKWKL